MAKTPTAAPSSDDYARTRQRPATTTKSASGSTRSDRRRPSTTAAQRQRSTYEDTVKNVTDPEKALAQQLANPEFIRQRGELAAEYVENLQLPASPPRPIPGFVLVPKALAQEAGLRGMVRGLEGTEDPWDTLDQSTPQPATAAVDGNTVASFVDNISGQQKDDVLATTLLAQLAANYRYDRVEDPFNWANEYSRVMMSLGWVGQESQHRRFESSQDSFTMDEVVIRMLSAILTEDARAILEQSIEALKGLRDDSGAVVIFERNTRRFNNGNFMIQPVGVSPSGVLSMTLGSFLIKGEAEITKILFFSFQGGPRTNVAINRNTLLLNQQVYDQIRDVVLGRIVSKIADYVRTVPLLDDAPPQPGGLSEFGSAGGWAGLR